MLNLFILFLGVFHLISCETNETVYLFDKNDQLNYQAALAAKQKQCENQNEIFNKLDETSDFDQYFKEKDVRIYKIERKFSSSNSAVNFDSEKEATNTITQMIFVVIKQDSTLSDQVEINITHSNDSVSDYEFLSKNITYTQKQNKDILRTVKVGACSKKYQSTMAKSYLTISDKRKQILSKKPEIYKEFSESLNFVTGLPALLYRWNGKVTQVSQDQYNKITNTWSAPKGVVEISLEQCKADYTCERALDDRSLPKCELVIDTTHYDANDQAQAMLTSFQNCN